MFRSRSSSTGNPVSFSNDGVTYCSRRSMPYTKITSVMLSVTVRSVRSESAIASAANFCSLMSTTVPMWPCSEPSSPSSGTAFDETQVTRPSGER